jgi:hypothetical protein
MREVPAAELGRSLAATEKRTYDNAVRVVALMFNELCAFAEATRADVDAVAGCAVGMRALDSY